MRILTRYILLDLVKVFFVTLTSMTAFVMLFLVGEEAVDNGYGLVGVLRTLPYFLPQSLALTVPGTMLLASTIVFGRVAASNEVVAIKSLGISPMVLIWPALVLATLIGFVAVWLNDTANSWGRGGVQAVLIESFEEITYGRLRTKGSVQFGRWEITVRDVVGKKLVMPIVHYHSTGKKPLLITADEAELVVDHQQNTVMIRLVNAEGVDEDREATHPGIFEKPLPIEELAGLNHYKNKPSNLALHEIGPAKAETETTIHQLKQEMTAEASFALMTGRSYELSQADWAPKQHEIITAEHTLHRLNTEPYRRWSGGLSSLFFVLIGTPMAIWRRHSEFWGNFFACFLPILLVFYPLLAFTVDFAKDGILPPQSVWLGNIVLACCGIWLIRRIVRF